MVFIVILLQICISYNLPTCTTDNKGRPVWLQKNVIANLGGKESSTIIWLLTMAQSSTLSFCKKHEKNHGRHSWLQKNRTDMKQIELIDYWHYQSWHNHEFHEDDWELLSIYRTAKQDMSYNKSFNENHWRQDDNETTDSPHASPQVKLAEKNQEAGRIELLL